MLFIANKRKGRESKSVVNHLEELWSQTAMSISTDPRRQLQRHLLCRIHMRRGYLENLLWEPRFRWCPFHCSAPLWLPWVLATKSIPRKIKIEQLSVRPGDSSSFCSLLSSCLEMLVLIIMAAAWGSTYSHQAEGTSVRHFKESILEWAIYQGKIESLEWDLEVIISTEWHCHGGGREMLMERSSWKCRPGWRLYKTKTNRAITFVSERTIKQSRIYSGQISHDMGRVMPIVVSDT